MNSKRADPEAEVFREAMRDVKPIDVRARVPPTKRKPPAKASNAIFRSTASTPKRRPGGAFGCHRAVGVSAWFSWSRR